ncbi:hypothetical protein MCOR25_011166 [Pyricularia grisea]|nr:hypothetical protein MCOR25_011166 [Pyricularia grisea]
MLMIHICTSGETEWAKSGRFTGTTDIELTEDGIKQVSSAGVRFVGVNNLINPRRLGKVFVSPRKRAVQTLELLLPQEGVVQGQYEVTATEEIAEWNYGRYEGLKEEEIRSSRKERGLDLDREWNIWRDGCESGEYDAHLLVNFSKCRPVLTTFTTDQKTQSPSDWISLYLG